jgi:predicted component of type VI protein secretion system
MLRDAFHRIMPDYPTARTEEFTDRPLASLIRRDLSRIFEERLPQYE